MHVITVMSIFCLNEFLYNVQSVNITLFNDVVLDAKYFAYILCLEKITVILSKLLFVKNIRCGHELKKIGTNQCFIWIFMWILSCGEFINYFSNC